MKNLIKIAYILLVVCAIYSCEDQNKDEEQDEKVVEINGVSQKGPFINGTSISVYELKGNLSPTGRTYNTQIIDNLGTYNLKDVLLTSKYVELKADGFYFNEISGENSKAQITLYAISDISNRNDLNINILSHLEKGRVEYLVDEGMGFGDAKEKAQEEILAIFNIDTTGIGASELLDISKDGEENAILLAISVILQAHRTDAELSELLANMITDLREDGELNSESLQTSLISSCAGLDLPQIRKNLEDRYEDLGESVIIPAFEKYVTNFIENSPYTSESLVLYPEFSEYGENILYGEKNTFFAQKNEKYSLAANLSQGGSVKIVIKGGMWYYSAIPHGPVNWKITDYDYAKHSQTFTSKESGVNCDLSFVFGSIEEQNDLTIEYYENGADVPTKVKHITVVDEFSYQYTSPDPDPAHYPRMMGDLGNVLSPENEGFYYDSLLCFAFDIELGDTIDVTIKNGAWKYDFPEEILDQCIIMEYDEDNLSQRFIFMGPSFGAFIPTIKFTRVSYNINMLVFEVRQVFGTEEKKWTKHAMMY